MRQFSLAVWQSARDHDPDSSQIGEVVALWIYIACVAAVVIWLVSLYRGLIARKSRFTEAFNQVDVPLRRRYELIPGLVDAGRALLGREPILDQLLSARVAVLDARAVAVATPGDRSMMQSFVAANRELDRLLASFLVLCDRRLNPDANDPITQLRDELDSAAARLSTVVRSYNDAVGDYNVAIRRFPFNMIANTFALGPGVALEPVKTPAVKGAGTGKRRKAASAA